MRLVAPPSLGDSMPPPVCAAAARDGEGERCDCSKAELDGGFDGGRKPMECSMAGTLEASIRDSSTAKRSAACAAIIISAPRVFAGPGTRVHRESAPRAVRSGRQRRGRKRADAVCRLWARE